MSALSSDCETDKKFQNSIKSNDGKPYRIKLIWRVIIIFAYLHISGIYGLYLVFTSAKVATTLFGFFLYRVAVLGVTAAVHRLWSHKCYKAKLPLQILLLIMNTITFQYSAIHWSKDHRVHHKYTDTDADPYNSTRSFFFCHIGWLFCEKHPDVIEKGKGIDFSDLYNNPLLKFQDDHYYKLALVIWFAIPVAIPMYFWNETFANAFYVAVCLRWMLALHTTLFINSFAHAYGMKPYDKNSSATENVTLTVLMAGEGWHNYHHAFPMDYRASELGQYLTNSTIAFIDFFAWIGWAYDLKTTSPDLIQKRVLRSGDGTHPIYNGKKL